MTKIPSDEEDKGSYAHEVAKYHGLGKATPVGGISFVDWVKGEIGNLRAMPMLEKSHGAAARQHTLENVLEEYYRRPHD